MRMLKIAIAFSTLGIAILIILFATKPDSLGVNHPLSISKRIFIEPDLKKVTNFEVVGKIIRIWRDKKHIWVSDANSKQIIEFTRNGIKSNEYGKPGGAIWENGSIWYFNKTGNTYYDYDYSHNAIRRFSISDDTLSYYYKPEIQVGNTIQYSDSLFFISDFETDTPKFKLIDIQEKRTVQEFSFQELVEKEFGSFPRVNKSLIFEGQYASNGTDVVYICYKFSCYFLLSGNGSIKLGRTIDGFDLPRAKNVDIGGGYTISGIEPDNFVNYASAISDTQLMILSNVVKESQSENRILDIYDLETLEYQNSILIPNFEKQRPIDLAYANGELTILYENFSIVNYAY